MHDIMQLTADSLSNLLAHAGHGPIDANHPAHYLTTPEHVFGVLATIACLSLAMWFASRWVYRISKPT